MSTIAHFRARDACTHSSGAFAGQHVRLQQSSSLAQNACPGPLSAASSALSSPGVFDELDIPSPGSNVVGRGAVGAGRSATATLVVEPATFGLGRAGEEPAQAAAV